jgi:hypothetical protein
MLAPREPTRLDWPVGTVAAVPWDVGPALARGALDHPDRTRRRKDRGSLGGPAVGSGPDPPGRGRRPSPPTGPTRRDRLDPPNRTRAG